MDFLLKLVVTNLVIITCVKIGKTMPALGGLIATMPLTSLIVMIWLHADSGGDRQLISSYTGGVLAGIGPTLLFFLVAWIIMRRGMPFGLAVAAGFLAWGCGAAFHQYLLS